MVDRELPLEGQILRNAPLRGGYVDTEEPPVASTDDATVITSEVEGEPGMHRVVLDIDMPGCMVPSTTPGHHHLYVDKKLSWEDYRRLIWVLADLGLVEEGYASSSDARGYTAVRLPWVAKDAPRTGY